MLRTHVVARASGQVLARRAAIVASVVGSVLASSHRAEASGAWLSSGEMTPIEQRVAVAVGPSRTTLWTSLRFGASDGGSFAIVVPAPPGASLDLSSDAWFESLEVGTAPRVLPPAGLTAVCPGTSVSTSTVEIVGHVDHVASLPPEDVAVLDDAAAVATWAAQSDLIVPPNVQAQLASLDSVRFIAVRFSAQPGESTTPTLRISMSGAPAMLPLALTRAASSDLGVTAWVIGPGGADLIGDAKTAITSSMLKWNAASHASNYGDLRASALAAGPTAFLVEAASHDALVETVPIANAPAFVDSVASTYFERAVAYGDGNFDSASCITSATTALASSDTVADVCPRAALGVIEPAPACAESVAAEQVDPSQLRCGSGADDLALALSGLAPSSSWITRLRMVIPASSAGANSLVGFVAASPTSPVVQATSVDLGDCNDGGAPGVGSSGSAGPFGSAGIGAGPGPGAGAGAGGSDPGDGYGDYGSSGGYGGSVAIVIPDTDANCSCSGTEETSGDASGDSCSSSTDSSSSGCDSSGSSDACSSSNGGDSCSSSSSSESCSSGGGGESCSGGGGGESCSGGGGDFKCSVARRPRVPKLSILLMAAMAVIAPLRRRGRKSRRKS